MGRPIRGIVVHHSATPDGDTLSWDDIKRYHVETNHWADIGYHAGIEAIGGSYQMLIGRPWTRAGAHAPDRNADTLGLCLVGNFDLVPPPSLQWGQAVALVRWWRDLFKIPVEQVFGHREVTPGRGCPGRYFDCDAFRSAVA